MEKVWTPERLSVLREKYLHTKLSMAQIAYDLNRLWGTNFNRNSICGAINRYVSDARKTKPRQSGRSNDRMDLSDKPKKETRVRVPKPRKPLKHLPPAARPVPKVERVEEPEVEVPPIGLMELREDTCHWPLGGMMDEPPFQYCGKRTFAKGPYCRTHARRAINSERGFKKKEHAELELDADQ